MPVLLNQRYIRESLFSHVSKFFDLIKTFSIIKFCGEIFEG